MCCIEYFIVSSMNNNKKIPITPSPVQKLASVHDTCHGQYLHSDWFKKLM